MLLIGPYRWQLRNSRGGGRHEPSGSRLKSGAAMLVTLARAILTPVFRPPASQHRHTFVDLGAASA